MSDTGPDDVYVGRDGEPRPRPRREAPERPPFVPEWRKVDFHARRLYTELTGRQMPEAPDAKVEDRASAYAVVAALAVLVDVGIAAAEVEHTRYDKTLATWVRETNQVLDSVERDRVHARVVAAFMIDEDRIPAEAWGALTKLTRVVLPDVANILLAVRKAQS